MQVINVIELAKKIQNPPYTIYNRGDRCEWIEECIEKAPIINIVFCEECVMHKKCLMEDTFATARVEDNQRFCGVGKKKMKDKKGGK